MTKLRTVGEFGLIARLEKILPKALSKGWSVAIGDDAAVRRLSGGRYQLLSKDLLLEGVHFLRGNLRHWETVGWKALAVNLSDIAAMGGRAVGALIGLGIPKDAEVQEVEALYRGAAACSKKYRCPVVGGDTNVSRQDWVISVTVVGESDAKPLLRSSARSGDSLWVTGDLGAAALAWRAIQQKKVQRVGREFLRRHARPEPRLAWGSQLAGSGMVTAMLDLSDGLGGDLKHLAEASGVGFEVELEALPKARGFDAACAKLGLDPVDLMVNGGEDYELLFTVRAGKSDAFRKLCLQYRISAKIIGRAIRGSKIHWFKNGKEWGQPAAGYRHF